MLTPPSLFSRLRGRPGAAAARALLQQTRSSSTTPAPSASSTMKLDAYATTSRNQYDAHLLTRDLLSSSMRRLAKRCRIEDEEAMSSGLPVRRRRIADLGSADGSSSMETLRFAVGSLNEGWRPYRLPLRATFEEHPASDRSRLVACLGSHDEWFRSNDVERDVLMQSFYGPLFEPESMDFIMSYICLHWLDTSDVPKGGSVQDWKTLGLQDGEGQELDLGWTHINEVGVPEPLVEAWRRKLAHRHLARFLSFRSREMRPGAEMLLVMVGQPNGYIRPPGGGQGPLSRAMKRCIDRGKLREEMLHGTVIPYFSRTTDDVKAAVELAAAMEVDDAATGTRETPGALLQLVDCHSFETTIKGDDANIIGGAFDLFWSIHSKSFEGAGPTEEELRCVREEARRVFDEVYDAKVGVPVHFIACTLRRRTREQWET